MPVLSQVSTGDWKQVYPMIGWATKALIRWQSGELWILGIWLSLDKDWIWIVGCGYLLVLDWSLDFGLSSLFVLNYSCTDFTLHLWFLFTTLTFTTRFPIIIR